MRRQPRSCTVTVRFINDPPHLRRTARCVSSIAIAVAYVFVTTASPLLAHTQDEIRAAKDAAIHHLDLQLELPATDLAEDWFWHLQIPPEYLLLALLLGLGILAWQFRDLIPMPRLARIGHFDGAAAAAEATARPPAALLLAADELAAEGRFVEGMHLLLLQALTAIRERLDGPFADSLTSREILRGARLPDSGKSSLRDIVLRVERSYFGKHSVERRDYDICRSRLGELARSLGAEIVA